MKYDQFEIGDEFKTKSHKISKEDILRFSGEFDPQYMHLDEQKANQGRFNGIIASGLHTLAISLKLWIEEGKYGDDIVVGTKVNNIKFVQPVYPDDELHSIVEVIYKKSTKPESGVITVWISTFNDKEELVLEGELSTLVKR